MGLIYLEKGDYSDAIDHFRKAMEIRESIGDNDGMAASMTTMAMAYAEMGEVDRALELYEKAMAIKEELGDRDGMAEVLGGMGRAYAYAGNHERAEDALRRSMEICREPENRRMLAYDLCALAESGMESGKDVGEMMEELESMVDDIGAREVSAWYLRLKGVYAHMNGEDGMPFLKESLELFREMGRKGDVGKTLYWMGKIKGKEGENEMREARKIFEEHGMKRWEERLKDFTDGTA